MNFEKARFNMVEQQIRTWNVLDAGILDALTQLPREVFVPQAYHEAAYADTHIPLPHGECMLCPRVAARLAQDVQIQPADRVLEIGTGSGYLTALLALRASQVTSLEMNAELAQAARQHLNQVGLNHAQVVVQDASQSQPTPNAYDCIVLSGSVAEVPQTLLNALTLGGRLLAVVGDEPMMQATLYTRVGELAWSDTKLWDTVLPRLHGFARTSAFHF